MGEQPGPFTVTDLFDPRCLCPGWDPPRPGCDPPRPGWDPLCRGWDPARLTGTAAALRALAARLDDAAGLLRRGQAGLGEMFERLDVPSVPGEGTLTFYPHDAADVVRVLAALQAAASIRAAVLAGLAA